MLDLFSGIGGFALAASWVWKEELEIVGFCEIDQYAQKVLKKHWPKVPCYSDIRELKGADFQDIDLITGGFPCQDISIAGKGRGINASRSGLWFEMHRVISEVQPRFVLVENVPALTFRGLGAVIGSLAEIGYDCEWQIVSAADVGAPHLRKRIWIVADAKKRENWRLFQRGLLTDVRGICQDMANPEASKRRGSSETSNPRRRGQEARGCCLGRDRSKHWQLEPNVGRVANGVPSRVDRLKCLGNAIVPQCAAVIMEQIKEVPDET